MTWGVDRVFAVLVLAAGLSAMPAEGQVRLRPKGPPRIIPPRVIDNLQKMSPEDREKALSQLPAARRAAVERRLNRLEQLTPEQKEQLQLRYEQFQKLPAERRIAVRRELQSLRQMRPLDRRQRINSLEFTQEYSNEEQSLLREALGAPPRPANSAR